MSDLFINMGKALKNHGFLGVVDCIAYFVTWLVGFCFGFFVILMDMELSRSREVNVDEIDDEELMKMIEEMRNNGPNG